MKGPISSRDRLSGESNELEVDAVARKGASHDPICLLGIDEVAGLLT